MADSKQAAQTSAPAPDSLKAELERLKAEARAAKADAEAARALAREAEAEARTAKQEKEAAEAKLKEQSDSLDAEVSRQEETILRQLHSQRKVRIIILEYSNQKNRWRHIMCELSPVAFHGDTIFCIDHQNQPYTPMRPIVENMRFAWQTQAAKLNASKERWTVTMIVTVAQDGIEREMLCLPVRKLPAWLASINPKKVRPELRPKIELYQAESDDALWNYWMNGRAERTRTAPDSSELSASLQSELHALVDAKLSAFPRMVQGRARSEIWARFNRHFKIARYCQLPAERMPEARDYLIEMEVKALASLPASAPLPMPKQDKVMPDSAGFPVPAEMDKRRERICRELYELQDTFGRLIDEIRFCLHPGGRLLRLPPELDNAYETLAALNRVATGGAYTARQAILSAYQIGKGLKFV